jgi:hypothetical protein
MYLGGIVAILVILFAVLMMVGVIPMNEKFVGGMFLAIAIGLCGPFLDRRWKVS